MKCRRYTKVEGKCLFTFCKPSKCTGDDKVHRMYRQVPTEIDLYIYIHLKKKKYHYNNLDPKVKNFKNLKERWE